MVAAVMVIAKALAIGVAGCGTGDEAIFERRGRNKVSTVSPEAWSRFTLPGSANKTPVPTMAATAMSHGKEEQHK